MKRLVELLCAGLVLTACGSSSSDNGGGGRASAPSFADLENLEATLETDTAGFAVIDPADLPDMGSARFEGSISFVLSDPADIDLLQVRGEVSVTANYAMGGGTITGSANNFIDNNDASYAGQFALANGTIDGTADPMVEATFEAFLDGAITDPNGAVYSATADTADSAKIIGEFIAPNATDNATHVRGQVTGDFKKDDVIIPRDAMSIPPENTFVAEQ